MENTPEDGPTDGRMYSIVSCPNGGTSGFVVADGKRGVNKKTKSNQIKIKNSNRYPTTLESEVDTEALMTKAGQRFTDAVSTF